MIKKLRLKFIALSMFSLLLVLLVIVGSINILNYRNITKNADNLLIFLEEHDGTFPKPDMLPGQPDEKDDRKNEQNPFLSPETPYESRYFSVLFSDTSSIISVDTGKIAAIDTAAAIEYAQAVLDQGKIKGFYDDYRYLMEKTSEDNVRIIFLDCSRSLSTYRTFLLTSCGISLLGMLGVLSLLSMLSGRIIRPVSESYEKQKQFITNAGHEIKTPLTIIDADVDILKMDLEQNEWLDDIKKQTKRLATLTNDLIFLSRLEEKTNPTNFIFFSLSDVAEETVQSFQTLAKAQGKNLNCTIKPMLSISGDEKSIRQLISILLDNAIKYSPAGGNILLVCEKQSRFIQLSVSNTTINQVTREQVEHIFDRFYRIDQSRNAEIPGYGIGLSIAKAIVCTHKGKITAISQNNNSLQITVILPFEIYKQSAID